MGRTISKQPKKRRGRRNGSRPKKTRAQRSGFSSNLERDNSTRMKNYKVDFEYEPFRMKYIVPKTYLLDFLLHNGIVVETKGRFLSQDRTKHELIRKTYPDLDLRFVFQRPYNTLNGSSKTTYADWCDKRGFKWAELWIPQEWWEEEPNEASLRTIAEIRGVPYEATT